MLPQPYDLTLGGTKQRRNFGQIQWEKGQTACARSRLKLLFLSSPLFSSVFLLVGLSFSFALLVSVLVGQQYISGSGFLTGHWDTPNP